MSNIKTELQYRIALGILGQMCSAGLVNDQEAETIRRLAARNTARKLFGDCNGYSSPSVVVLALTKLAERSQHDGIRIYAEQIYRLKKDCQARVLPAQEAEALGYEDGYTA
ncbi:MAG: hypothetical protein ACLRNW_01895 [Neglectibacter sp.]